MTRSLVACDIRTRHDAVAARSERQHEDGAEGDEEMVAALQVAENALDLLTGQHLHRDEFVAVEGVGGAEVVDLAAGRPRPAHLDGDRWDYLVIWPLTTPEQDRI